MRLTEFRMLAMVSALIGFVPSTANASLIGDTVAAQYVVNSPSNVLINEGTAVVGNGVEFPHAIDDNLQYDFDANSVTISFDNGQEIVFAGVFSGPAFEDLTNPFTYAALDPASTMPGFDASRLSLSDGTVIANLQMLSLVPGQKLIIDFVPTSTAVPEPLTLSLFGAGLAGAVAMRRRKKKV